MAGTYLFRGDDPIFEITDESGYLILHISERPVDHNYESKQHEYNRLYRTLYMRDNPCVLFDLSRCVVMDSITIGILVKLTTLCRQRRGTAVVACVAPNIQESFESLMLLQADKQRATWRMFDTVSEAKAAFPW
ncbi:STAS domain-containing protein [Rubinisphaera margarita]|uniref:STAS domain-containing protein n=1 Tax=Rubinisphaera margarita TaxID=2909586 RepID=UPI001EE7EC52|nr:STAS domain-containing protein [Rubinisphaera margarita]MCG6157438.1 STAS domain-containing protein [Rubinisphaera margarita]